MDKSAKRKPTFLILPAVIVMVLSTSTVLAWGHYGRHFPRYHAGFYHGYSHHGWYGWPYYNPSWTRVTVVAPPIGAYVAYLPDGYTTFVLGENRYYCYNGIYFRPYSDGFMVVSPPVQKQEPAAQPAAAPQAATQNEPAPPASAAKPAGADTVTVGVPNSKGGFTSVQLVKHKDGYLGPQGEYYAGHPTVGQLKMLYGN
jgi:hypothetical protein